jgi:hypothetical protein
LYIESNRLRRHTEKMFSSIKDKCKGKGKVALVCSITACVDSAGIKGKGVPLRARFGPEGSRRFRLPEFTTFGT